MQGKELPKQEATGKSSVGVDVGKSFLDIHVLPSGQSLRLPNTKEGIRRLKRFLKGFDLGLVVLEATGKWHRAAHRSLCADGVPVAVVDPFKARMFAKASGVEGLSGILCVRRFSSLTDEPITEHNGELGLGLAPFAGWPLPLFGSLVQNEI